MLYTYINMQYCLIYYINKCTKLSLREIGPLLKNFHISSHLARVVYFEINPFDDS